MQGSDGALATWGQLCRVHGAVARRVEGDLEKECGVSLLTYTALRRLSEAPDRRLRLSALVEEGALTKSGISRMVDRLEKSGLISTEGCPSDRRGSFAVLTPAGDEVVRKAAAIFGSHVREAIEASLPPEDVETLGTLLQRIS